MSLIQRMQFSTLLAGALLTVALPLPAATFLRGDANASGGVELTDAIQVLGFLFGGEALASGCQDAADVDDNGQVQLTDAVYILSYLFRGGAPPAEPYEGCGNDETLDELPCPIFAACSVDREGLILTTPDGLKLSGYYLAGGPPGSPGVILAHQYLEDDQQWGDFPEELAAQGWIVLAFSMRGHGESDAYQGGDLARILTDPNGAPVDLEAALGFLVGEGVADPTRVAVVGTSIGANLAVLASVRKWARAGVAISPRKSAIEALSAGKAQGMSGMAYYASEMDNPGDSKTLHEATAAPRAVSILPNSSDHGIAILRQYPETRGEVIEFLRTAL